MSQHDFSPAAGSRCRGFRTLQIALAAGLLAAASLPNLAAQTPGKPQAATTAAAGPAAAQPAPNATPPGSQTPPGRPSGSPAATSDVGTPIIRTAVNEVSLIFTVTDKHGHYIPNLTQSDFALLDDQKAPARVNSFHQQINLPLRVGILIDTSSSIRSRFEFEQQSATDFLLQVLRAKNDRAFVMGFDETPTVYTDWTNDLDALESGVNKMSPGGGTALYDAVYTACHDKLLPVRGPEPFRKAIILVSDGNDDVSHVYLSEAIRECQRADTILYAISTNWTPTRGEGDKSMTQLAEQTGGEVFFPPSAVDITESFKSIEDELRSQYAIVYTPADFKSDGAFRSIYLYCYDRRYQVHARKGYFAPRN